MKTPSEETISENRQIRELHGTIKLLNEEVTFSDASARTIIFESKN